MENPQSLQNIEDENAYIENQYQEMLAVYGNTGTDVLTGEKVVLDESMVVGPLGYLIVKLKK